MKEDRMMAMAILGWECSDDSGGSAAIQPTVWLRFTETARVPPTARLELDSEVLRCFSIIAFKTPNPISPISLRTQYRNQGRRKDFMNKKRMKIELEIAIAKALITDLHKTHEQIAEDFGVGEPYLRKIAKRNGILRKRGKGSPAWKFKQQAGGQLT